MINTSRLDTLFEQQPNSCVMSSYAIVSNYFNSSVAITDLFDEYCRFFKMPFTSQIQSEIICGDNLNSICQNLLGWRGYQMIDYLHNRSTSPLFINNRNLFTAHIHSLNSLTNAQYSTLINILTNDEALANVLTVVNGRGYHSRTLCVDQTNNLIIHDTAPNVNPKIIPSYLNNNDILECIIYKKI